MALQGTIDTFPLADVLQLLSASSKTGRLLLDGDRGQMTLWIDNGEVIGGEAATPPGDRAELLLFEMLRFTDGAFAFDSDIDGEPGFEVAPVSLEGSLQRALELLESWASIEAVVPSPAHQVTMVAELPEGSVEIDRATWRLLTVSGRSVAQVADALGLDEFTTTSAIAELVQAGLLEVDEPADAIAEVYELYEADEADEADETGEPDEVAVDAESGTAPADDELVTFPDRFPIDDLIGGDDVEEDDPWTSPEMERLEAQRFAAAQSFDAIEVEPVPLLGPSEDSQTDVFAPSQSAFLDEELRSDRSAEEASAETADEVLRQMSKLSPKAAEAIAAALNSVPSGAGERNGSAGEDDGPVSFSGSF